MTSLRENVIRQVYPPPGPIRVLVAANLAHGLANGMLLTVVVLFFTNSVGIPAAQLGIGLTTAARETCVHQHAVHRARALAHGKRAGIHAARLSA